MNLKINTLIAGAVALSALAPMAAHAQTSTLPVQHPFAVKLGVAFGTDGHYSSSSFDGGLSYDFKKTTADNPVIYQVYGDYYGKNNSNLFGFGLAGKFLLGNASAVNKPYVGVGIGDYVTKIDGSSTKSNFGGKAFLGYDLTQSVFAEVDYTITQKNNGVSPDAVGLRLGYKF